MSGKHYFLQHCCFIIYLFHRLLNIIHGFREVCGFKPMHELNEFPNSITFQQIVATWKHVAFYKRKHEHENDGQDKHVQV